MKLHLPSKLRNALLACMTAMVGITTTCATGALVAGALSLSQARAAADLWYAYKWNEYGQQSYTVTDGNILAIAGSISFDANGQLKYDGQGYPLINQPADADWSSNEKYGKAFTFKDITVEEGGQLYLLLHRDKSQTKNMTGAITLKGTAPTEDGVEDLAALLIDDGVHNFTQPITIDGYVTIETRYSCNQTFTNLTATNETDELHFRTTKAEGRQVVYTLAYNKDLPGAAYKGTIVVETPKDDGLVTNPVERVALSISHGNTISGAAKFVVEEQAALWLSAGGLNIGEVDLKNRSVLRNNAGGSQVRQNINKMLVNGFAQTYLYTPNGTTQWRLDSIEGDGFVTSLFEGESYNPSIIYLNHPNENFTGYLTFNNHDELAGAETSNHGIYQNYVEIGHSQALANANLALDGSSISPEWTVLALASTDAYIGSFQGNGLSLVSAGSAPTNGTASRPSTAIRPASSASTKTLHMGAIQPADAKDYFYGIVLPNVNLSKEGEGTQVIANIEADPSRYIFVKSGTLEMGSLGEFYRIVVSNGARAEIGFSTSSKAHSWGNNGQYRYYDLVGNDIDLSDSTKIQGNVVLTDKIYNRAFEGRASESTITVIYLDPATYTKDTLTVVGADLAVFNPNTGRDAGLSSVGSITLMSGGSLVSAAREHHSNILLGDPNIVVGSDLVIRGTGYLQSYGSLYQSYNTQQWEIDGYNTTYSGSISSYNGASDELIKEGFGKVTLSGDMSDFNAILSVNDGTMVLSGANGRIKNFSALGVYAWDKALLQLTNQAKVTSESFQFERVIGGGGRYAANLEIEAGSSLTLTGVNNESLDDINPTLSYQFAPFVMSNVSHGKIDVYGTLTMERMSNISVVSDTAWKKSIDIHAGGVYNAKGLWLQVPGGGEGAETYVTIHSGATLNIGEDGIGHANKDGKGNVQGADNNDLILTFEDGATLGVLNECREGWSTERTIDLAGVSLTVNTQGYVIDDASTRNGTAKTITMSAVTGSIVKEGLGTLVLRAGSNIAQTTVNEGYVALSVEDGAENYNIALGKVATNGNGSLLFDLVSPIKDDDQSGIPTDKQPHATMTELTSTKLNLTVRQGTTGQVGKTYAVLLGAPEADKVNLIALVDDGVDARYELEGGFGYVTLTNTDVVTYGSDKLLTWMTNGQSDFWANSTQKNWKDDENGARRFTNDSDVQFVGAGESITVLDEVWTGDVTITGTGYEFTGAGSIYGRHSSVSGEVHKMTVADGASVTFSNTGSVYFEGGVELGAGATLRLEYLSTAATPNWQAPVTGDEGTLVVATSGIRTNVLTSVMGSSVGTVALDNYTTIEIGVDGSGEAAKLAAAKYVDIREGSRLYITSGREENMLEAGDTLSLAGAGKVGDLEGCEAVLTVAPNVVEDEVDGTPRYTYYDTNTTILADTVLKKDSTIYVGNDFWVENRLNGIHVNPSAHGSLTLSGGFCSNGNTLTKAGMGELILCGVDSSAKKGDIVVEDGRLTFNFDERNVHNPGTEPTAVANKISMESGTALQAGSYVALEGGLYVEGAVTLSAAKGMAINAPIVGNEVSVLTVGGGYQVSGTGNVVKSIVTLNTANPDYEGSWMLMLYSTLQLNHENAARNASILADSSYDSAWLELGAASDTYYAAGLGQTISVVSAEEGVMKTLVLDGSQVYDAYRGCIGKDVTLVKNGKGAQKFTRRWYDYDEACFADGYNGSLIVNEGLLQFRNTPGTFNTLKITSDDAELCFGYPELDEKDVYTGRFVTETLTLGRNSTDGSAQTLLITETGATLNAHFAPVAGGHIILGTEDEVWTAHDGLKMYGRTMTLDTTTKSDLTINLSAFMEAGTDVDLFSQVGTLVIDGVTIDRNTEIGCLADFFECDDINLAEAMLTYTDVGTLRIRLTNATDGQYYEYNGGTSGDWNTTDNVWATKDDAEGKYRYKKGAAYFTNADEPTTVTLTEDITAREMAVKNGNYTFVLADGNDLTIESQFYEKEDADVTFLLNSDNTTDANGNPVTDGARLTVESGMGELHNTEILNDDGSTANTVILGGKTKLMDQSRIDGVALYMEGVNSKLDLTTLKSTKVVSLSGDGSIVGEAAEMVITGDAAGSFQGSLLGTENAAAGANLLTIGVDGKNALQSFKNVTTDESWSIVNNGKMDFAPTENSTLHSLALTGASATTLTVNTDKSQLLGLTSLSVEDGAAITLNSTGTSTILSGENTPGMSYKVLGTFADDAIDFDIDSLEIQLGSGSAFLMIDKTKPVTLEAIENDRGLIDLVLKATVNDSNPFTHVVEEGNASAGAEMLGSAEAQAYISEHPDSDMAKAFNAVAGMVTSTDADKGEISKALAAVAGSSTAVLGSAFSADVERQLKAIRNRTTTMGVSQCEVNENMPYYNAWINAEGNHRELDADGLAAGYTHDSWGGTVGFDVDVTPSVTMGLALTAMYGDIESDGPDKAEGDFDTMYLSAFARYARNAWVHTFVATVGRADVTLDRTVNVGGYSYKTTGDTDGMAFGFMYEVGRVFAANEDGTTCWQPVFNVALRNSSISGYEEEGSDAALSVGDQDFTTITFGLGARMQTIMGENLYNRTSIFEARALLKFDVGDTETEASTAMLNSDGKAHPVEGVDVGEIGVELGAGVTIPVGAEGGSIFVDASAELRSGYTNINGTVGYRVNF